MRRLQELQTPAKETVVYDAATAGALAIRLRPSGGKTFVVRYRVTGAGVTGSPRWFVIGRIDKVNLDDARRKATSVMLEARAGRDPSGERREQARAAALAAPRPSLGELIDHYEAALQERSIKSSSATGKRLRKFMREHLTHPAAELTRAALVKVLAATTRGTQPTLQANVHGMLAHGYNAGLLPANVMAGYKRPRGSRKARNIEAEEETGIALDMEEIAALWRACDDRRIARGFAACVRLLIITGCRRDEIANAERSWLHPATPDEAAHMIVPGRFTKNGKTLFLPLPALAMGAIAQSPRINGSDLLCPGGVSRKTGKVSKISG